MEPKPHPRGNRQRQKEETRVKILDAARALFEQHGFQGATMRAVAARAGVATGTIFTHFPDKGALLIEAILEDLAVTDQRIAETLPASPIRAQILHMAEAGFGTWCRRPALSSTLLREMYLIDGPSGERRRVETARFVSYCRELLEKARGRGELRYDVDCTAAAHNLYNTYIGRLIQAAGDNDFDLDAMLADFAVFVDQLLAGIGSRPD
jgi:AcrR family transcriptional regulator